MSTITPATLPKQIEIDATRSSIADVTAYLQKHLGQRLTAYLSGLKDAKTVGQWAAGKVTPRDAASLRLRHAYQAVRLLVEAFGDETAKAWLFGINSQLDDEAPAFVLRHARLPDEITPVVVAARSFSESGHRPRALTDIEDVKRDPEELRRFFGALAEGTRQEILRLLDDEGKRASSSKLRSELLQAGGTLAERSQVLELAREEIAKSLDRVIEDLKGDLELSAREVSR